MTIAAFSQSVSSDLDDTVLPSLSDDGSINSNNNKPRG